MSSTNDVSGDLLLSSQSLDFLDHLYRDYLRDPASVSGDWRQYFDRLAAAERRPTAAAAGPFPARSIFNMGGGTNGHKRDPRLEQAGLQERVDMLIRCYRVRGHIVAKVDPLEQPTPSPAELDPAFYGFTDEDLDKPFSTAWFGGPKVRTLREVLTWLRNTYCRSIGVQFMHIDSLRVRQWLQLRMETTANHLKLARDEQIRILTRLSDAVLFEEFVQKKYIGAKSFSLEGAESLIPLLDLAIEKAAGDGIRDIVFGMAHRGRLNVLANIMGKSPRLIFREFEDKDPERHIGRGDVKYHMGYSSYWTTSQNQEIHLTLCFNPSHLGFVGPVALGRMRARQTRENDREGSRGLCILIHGDAAFAGEGISQETLNLSELRGYSTGGTIHVVVNNQLGFTTSPCDARSSTYATDVAKMLQVPIFHVNGEDPEAVAQVVRLALDFRREFHRDVVIDMYCYRRRGHNEGDEPEFTQPTMYRAIRERKSVFEGYLEHLLSLRGITREEADDIAQSRRELLEAELEVARADNFIWCVDLQGPAWRSYRGGEVCNADDVHTAVDRGRLSQLLHQTTEYPDDFKPHPKVMRLLKARRAMSEGKQPLDWGAAELLSFASLLSEGSSVRLTGQDVCRGTFSHRHAVLYGFEDGAEFPVLESVAQRREDLAIYNSPLSEAGVLGFEYGYSLETPDGLVIWEAQFGDFVNAAQVIVDQFIATGEEKWDRLSGIVLLLPHGFEGQGPEHSSARLERFLTLAAEDNIQVMSLTTPAQYYHCLRRQALRKWKKPMVIMTPKSLLRHKRAVSNLDELATGRFLEVLEDNADIDPSAIKRVLLCSGKIYYELLEEREQRERTDIGIVRLEQLYPFPQKALQSVLDAYPSETPVTWVQEEPENMGAWRYLRVMLGTDLFGHPFDGVQRPESATPATGSGTSHKLEQKRLIDEAFASQD